MSKPPRKRTEADKIYSRKYYAENREKCIEAVMACRKANREYYNHQQNINYAKRKASAVGSAVTSAVDTIQMKVTHGKFVLTF
jgi:hypothetical protein